jgi:hypothetical protein
MFSKIFEPTILMPMIDVIEKITNHLISLAQYRQDAERRLFLDHIEAIYSGLNDVTKDFHDMFDGVIKRASDYGANPEDIRAEIEDALKKRRTKRWETTHYAEALAQSKASREDIQAFCDAARLVIVHYEGEVCERRSTTLRFLGNFYVQNFKEFELEQDEIREIRETFILDMKKRQANLDEDWKKLSVQYHALRVSSMK